MLKEIQHGKESLLSGVARRDSQTMISLPFGRTPSTSKGLAILFHR